MRQNRDKRLLQEVNILSGRKISVEYLMNVFDVSRQSILQDLRTLKKNGYNVKKIDDTYVIQERIVDVIEENLQKEIDSVYKKLEQGKSLHDILTKKKFS